VHEIDISELSQLKIYCLSGWACMVKSSNKKEDKVFLIIFEVIFFFNTYTCE
jgi:hypothetical protein